MGGVREACGLTVQIEAPGLARGRRRLAGRRELGTGGTGEFGADMQVSLTNDGPVTFWLSTN